MDILEEMQVLLTDFLQFRRQLGKNRAFFQHGAARFSAFLGTRFYIEGQTVHQFS